MNNENTRFYAIYTRQSVERPDSVSLEAQADLCRRTLPEGAPVRVFSDAGFSGKNTARPALRALMAAVDAGQVIAVVVYRLDRISRNIADFTALLARFRSRGTAFSSCTEQFETGSPMGQAMQSLLMVFAQLERETISARVRDAAFARARLGLDPGGPAPVGYQRTPALLNGRRTSVLSPSDDAPRIAAAYARYLCPGVSLADLAADWNRQGFAAPRGGLWSSATVARVLRNPRYARADSEVCRYLAGRGAELVLPADLPEGHAVQLYTDRRRNARRFTDLTATLAVPAPFAGIVPGEVWLSCQKKLDSARKARTFGKGARSWLSGLCRCGSCGAAMTVTRGRSADYLVCAGRKRHRCAGAGAVWRVADAETLAGLAVQARLADVTRLGGAPAEQDGAAAELERLTLRRERLLAVLTGDDPPDIAAVAEAADRLGARCEALRHQLAERAAQTNGTQSRTSVRLPEWESLTLRQKQTAAAIVFRGIWLRGEEMLAVAE